MLSETNLYNLVILGYLIPWINSLVHYVVDTLKDLVYSRFYKTIVVNNNMGTYAQVKYLISQKALGVNRLVADATNRVRSDNVYQQRDYHWSLAYGHYKIATEQGFIACVYSKDDVQLSCYSWRGFKPLQATIDRARAMYKGDWHDFMSVYTPGNYAEWTFSKTVNKRGWDTVILEPDAEKTLRKTLTDWSNHKRLYTRLGIPHKKTILFHGVPGMGKSSLVTVVAAHLEKTIYNLDLLNIHAWTHFARVPEDSVILIEDIDRYFAEKRDPEKNDNVVDYVPKFDMAKLMNSLDGNSVNEGCVIIITANDLDKLPAVLLRPGRIDTCIEFGYTTRTGCSRYLDLFYDGTLNDKTRAQMTDVLCRDKELTYAKIQHHLFSHVNDPKGALKKLKNTA